ncbi:hypothetical protein ACFWA4_34555 [Streptomyces sp. NPDC060011]|uniref:hypothetical protein n=1 Tax=Streptomyces sp. NPDC060011 TaxID=3347037 RepID=UPI0036CCECD6
MLIAVLVIACCSELGVWLYTAETKAEQRRTVARSAHYRGAASSLRLQVNAQQVYPGTHRVLLIVLPLPQGSLGARGSDGLLSYS